MSHSISFNGQSEFSSYLSKFEEFKEKIQEKFQNEFKDFENEFETILLPFVKEVLIQEEDTKITFENISNLGKLHGIENQELIKKIFQYLKETLKK